MKSNARYGLLVAALFVSRCKSDSSDPPPIEWLVAEDPFRSVSVDRRSGIAVFFLKRGHAIGEFVNLDLLRDLPIGVGIEEAIRRLGPPERTSKGEYEREAVFERSGGRIRVRELDELSSVDGQLRVRRFLYLRPTGGLARPLPPSIAKVLKRYPSVTTVQIAAMEGLSVGIELGQRGETGETQVWQAPRAPSP